MDRTEKLRQLDQLRASVRQLEAELAQDAATDLWPPTGYYTAYHVLAGCVLGMTGAMTSLLLNVIGSLLVGQHPLQLIRVYLTFPMGESALRLESGLALAIGCCLYLMTGMVLGVPFHLVLSRWFRDSSTVTRILVASLLALALWGVNFYGLLSWLEPLLFGGRWIVQLIPWWVAALTHLVFGWTVLLLQPWSNFLPYRVESEGA